MTVSSFNYYIFRKLRNTNDEIKKIGKTIKKENIGLFCIDQEKGRGRQKRSWSSKKGDLTCSFLINRRFKIEDIGKINLFVASILINTLQKIGIKDRVEFKWPNDIFIKKKKIGGVLIETVLSAKFIEQIVLGIGINHVEKSIKNNNYSCISLNELENKVNPLTLFFHISEGMNYFMSEFEKKNFRLLSENLSKLFFNKDKPITIQFPNNTITGSFNSINENGELIITQNNCLKKINFGEII